MFYNPNFPSAKIYVMFTFLVLPLQMSVIATSIKKVLNDDVVPTRYELYIDTDISDVENEMFRGYVVIHGNVNRGCKSFSLNSDGLKILETKISQDSEILHKHEIKTDQTILFSFTDALKISLIKICIKFEGKIEKSLSGYYASTYKKNKRMYSTHFEPTSARSAFPCFDQPDRKAVFRIALGVPKELTALSNSAVVAEVEFGKANPGENKEKTIKEALLQENIDSDFEYLRHENCLDFIFKSQNQKLVLFKDTIIMSTYLVAYAVGDLSYIEDFLGNVRIRVYTPRGEQERGRFALDVSKKCLGFFEDYFDIKYPLEKLDHLAVPDFAMGAMENWGLITYRKSSLLMDSRSPTQTVKNIAETVCHELAHQWFGNLATMQWWNDIWLNEGFATWAAALGVANINIGWDIWTSFINNDVEYGMSYDSLHSTHEIQVDVNDPEEIDQIFDGISYSKGASLIKMLEDYVGEDVFKNALRKYLKDFEYKNATTTDLWERIEDASGKEIQGMMNYWTTFKGFPLVEVTNSNDKLILKQERFFLIADYVADRNILSEENKDETKDISRIKKGKSKAHEKDIKPEDDKDKVKNILSNKKDESKTPENDINSKDNKSDTESQKKKDLDISNSNPVINEAGKVSASNSNGNHDDFKKSDLMPANFEPMNQIESEIQTKTNITPQGFAKVSNYDGPSQGNNKKKIKLEDQSTWRIPVRIKFFNLNNEIIEDVGSDTLYEFEKGTVELNRVSTFYKLNDQGHGFYRVKYTDINVPLTLLKSDVLSVPNKLNILNDLYQLSIGSYITCTIPIQASLALLKDESNYDLLSAGLAGINDIKGLFYDDESKKTKLESIALSILNGREEEINLRSAGDSFNDKCRNSVILSSAVTNNHAPTIERLNDMFSSYKEDETSIHPNFLSAMFVSVVKKNSPGLFEELWNMYLNEGSDDIKNIILSSLGSTEHHRDFLKKEIMGNNVKIQDKIYLFASLTSNMRNRDDIIDFSTENFKSISEMFGKNASLLSYVIERVFGSIADDKRRERAMAVFESNDIKPVLRAVDKALEKSAIKIRFRANNTDINFDDK